MHSIWVEPATEDAKYLLGIIKKLGKKYDSPIFRPHITVYGKIRSAATARLATERCKGVKKFTVKTADMAFSDDLWKTVFVNTEKNNSLRKIHCTIQKAVPLSPKYKFCPHISLMYKKMDDSEKQAIIDGLIIKRKLTFDKITIIASSNDVAKWKTLDRVVLK